MALGAPSDTWAFLRSRLFSWRGKARMALERFVAPSRGGDESIASSFGRRLGRGLQIGRRAATGGPGPVFYTLRDGLNGLRRALVERLPPPSLRLNAAVCGMSRPGGQYAVATTAGETIHARSVLLAVPPRASAELLRGLDPGLADLPGGIPMASTATVLLGYRRRDVGHPLDGHGLLIPRSEGLRTTACSFVSSKFSFRSPDGHVLLRAFIGGMLDRGAVSLGAPGVLALARQEMEPLLGITAAPVVSQAFLWPEAMPQMEVGHAARMEALEAGVRGHPGLWVTGAGLHGTGIPDAIADARHAADAAARFLSDSRAA